MRRLVIGASTLVAALVLAAPVHAQNTFFVGAYANLPQSNFKDAAKTGWMAAAGFKPYASADGRFGLWVEGEYGQNSSKADGGEKTKLLMGMVTPTYNLTSGSSATPYLMGSVGYLHSKVGDYSSNALVYGGGVGVGIGQNFWIDGRYMSSKKNGYTTSFILAGAGVSF
jgi:hypothetical protein